MSYVERTVEYATEEKISPSNPGVRQGGWQPRFPGWKPVLLAGAAIAALTVGGMYVHDYWTEGRFLVSTDDAYVQADTTVIAPKVSGYLAAVLVGDNQAVKAGQPLARIDDRDYRVALEQARADVQAAEAEVRNVRASLNQQQAEIAQTRASVGVDQANVTFTQQDNDRYVSLARTGAGSVQNEQQAVSRYAVAQATLQRDAAAVISAERRQQMLEAQLAKAQAVQAHDEAVEDQAALNLSYTTIVSPVDGVVGNRTLRVGQYVTAGTQLMAVVPVDGVYVVANYKETQLTDVRPGQKASIEVDMFPGTVVHGHVDSIAPASGQEFALLPPDNATGNFTKIVQRIPVKIMLEKDDPLAGMLRPGMSVTPDVDTRKE